MKTLPDNPNLDHLRQQAKDLLAGLRDSDPDVSLSTAQAALAEQYGFRTWTDLKAEVDRLRGRADIADTGLASAIASRFSLGEVSGPTRSVARPDDNGRRWLLETDRGRWSVRTMDTWIPIVDAETDIALQQAAAGTGIALPAPVRSRGGRVVESIGGHSWRVYTWLPAGPPLTAPVSSAITARVGAVLAKIHGLRMPVDRISPWHAARLSATTWPELAAAARARRAGWSAALAAAVPDLVDLETVGDGTPPGTPVLCHNNLTPGNVRLGANGRLIVLDWEHAGGQPPAWELCDALAHWAIGPGGEINAPGARAMVDAYRSEAGSLPELNMAAFRGTAIGLANYVFGLVSEAMQASDDEDRRHADRSVQHLLAHLPSRTHFERLLDAALTSVTIDPRRRSRE